MPLRDELANRAWRRLLASCIDEALAPRRGGHPPAKVGALPPALIPKVLRLPDALFRIVAAAQLRIDPKARIVDGRRPDRSAASPRSTSSRAAWSRSPPSRARRRR